LTGEINSKLPFAPVSSFVLDFVWLVVAGVQITAETFVLDKPNLFLYGRLFWRICYWTDILRRIAV